jgi:hypothetical protein
VVVHVKTGKKQKTKKIPALPRAWMAGTRQRWKAVHKNSSFAESLPGWLSAKEGFAESRPGRLSAKIFFKKIKKSLPRAWLDGSRQRFFFKKKI